MTELRARITQLLVADVTAEADSGFPMVRRIPSTLAVKFVDYFAMLNPGDAAELLTSLAQVHAMQFFPGPVIYHEALEMNVKNQALLRYRDATRTGQFAYGLRYQDFRMARMMLKDPESLRHMAETRSKLNFTPRDDPPDELMPEPDRLMVETA